MSPDAPGVPDRPDDRDAPGQAVSQGAAPRRHGAGPGDEGAADDLLSAAVDGRLAPAEAEQLSAEVERSPALRAELEALAAVKAQLAALPEVEPPVGFLEGLMAQARSRRYRTTTMASVVATAAAWVVVIVLGGTDLPDVEPELAAYGDRHEQFSGEAEASLSGGLRPTGSASIVSGFNPPEALGGEPLDAVYRDQRTGLVQLLYGSPGEPEFSVFAEPGEVDWTSLPSPASELDGEPYWYGEVAGSQAAVFQAGDLVVSLVAGDDWTAAELRAVAQELPDPSGPSWGARLRATFEDLAGLLD